MGFEFEGVEYAKSRDMQAVRRQRYVECLDAGMNFTQAAHAVGVSKRTGKVWRTGAPAPPGVTRNRWCIGTLSGWNPRTRPFRADTWPSPIGC